MNLNGRKTIFQPLYDTLWIDKYDTGPKTHLLFAQPFGQQGANAI